MKTPHQKEEERQERKTKILISRVHDDGEKFLASHPSLRLISHPQRTLIVGKSQSGKTTLAIKIILYVYSHLVDNLYVMSSTADLQSTYKPIMPFMAKERTWGVATKENIIKFWSILEKEKYKKRSLLFIDDQSSETGINAGGKGEFSWLIYNAVWANLSILAVTHRPTAISPAFRENLEHVILMEQSNNRLRDIVEKEFNILDTKKQFRDLLIEHTEMRPHGAIHISFKPPATIHPQFNVRDGLNSSKNSGLRQSSTDELLSEELGGDNTHISSAGGDESLQIHNSTEERGSL